MVYRAIGANTVSSSYYVGFTHENKIVHCLRNCSRKFAIFASSIFCLILASIQSWILEFWASVQSLQHRNCLYRTHRTSAQLFAVMFVLRVTTSHFFSQSQQSPSTISFGQSIMECIVHNFILVREISDGMQIFNVLFIFIFYLYI